MIEEAKDSYRLGLLDGWTRRHMMVELDLLTPSTRIGVTLSAEDDASEGLFAAGDTLRDAIDRMKQDVATGAQTPLATEVKNGLADLEPRVAGRRLSWSIATFVRACHVCIGTEQERPNPDNALINVLAEAIRFAREHVDMVNGQMRATSKAEVAPEAGAWWLDVGRHWDAVRPLLLTGDWKGLTIAEREAVDAFVDGVDEWADKTTLPAGHRDTNQESE